MKIWTQLTVADLLSVLALKRKQIKQLESDLAYSKKLAREWIHERDCAREERDEARAHLLLHTSAPSLAAELGS